MAAVSVLELPISSATYFCHGNVKNIDCLTIKYKLACGYVIIGITCSNEMMW